MTGFADKHERLHKYPILGFTAIVFAIVYVFLNDWTVVGVSTNLWGGLFLTLVIAGVAIVAALPGGVALALARRSHMPVIRISATAFIELFRSVPLISVLFMAVTMMPLFLPPDFQLNKLVQAEPKNQAAKDLLADVFEQIGYQQENPGLRNSYLSGAFELRSGIPGGAQIDSASPDVMRAMSTELFLDFLGIRMDSRKAEGMQFTINLITPDNGEKFLIELSNSTLNNIEGFLADNPDLSITINRSDLEQVMMGAKSLEAQMADGTAKVEGNKKILQQLASTMVVFDPRFEIMPGTRGLPRRKA